MIASTVSSVELGPFRGVRDRMMLRNNVGQMLSTVYYVDSDSGNLFTESSVLRNGFGKVTGLLQWVVGKASAGWLAIGAGFLALTLLRRRFAGTGI